MVHTLNYKKWDHDIDTQKMREHTEKTELASQQQRAQEDRGHSYHLMTSQFQTSGLHNPKIICIFSVFLPLLVLLALLVLFSGYLDGAQNLTYSTQLPTPGYTSPVRPLC